MIWGYFWRLLRSQPACRGMHGAQSSGVMTAVDQRILRFPSVLPRIVSTTFRTQSEK